MLINQPTDVEDQSSDGKNANDHKDDDPFPT